MTNKTLTFIYCCLFSVVAQAQQRMQYSQYMQNAFLLNPSLCGTESYHDIKAGFASQWNGFDGPKSTFVTAQFSLTNDTSVAAAPVSDLAMRGRKIPVKSANEVLQADTSNKPFKQGAGIVVWNEGDNVISQTELSFAYGAHFLLKKQTYFSGGLSLGLRQNYFNPEGIRLINTNDLVFSGGARSIFMPSMNLGISLYNRRWFVALSSAQVLNNSYSYDAKDPNRPSRLQPHHYLMGGYKLNLGGMVYFTPSCIVRYAYPSAPSVDINGMLDYKDQFRFGISYRHKESVVALFGFYISHLIGIHYAFDFISSPIKNYSTGTHGLIVSVRMGTKKSKLSTYHW